MKNKALKNKFAAALLLATAGYAGIASALPYTGALGAAAGATDVWIVACPTTTAYLAAQILDRPPVAAPLVSVQVIRAIKAANSTDPMEDAAYSPFVGVTGSTGGFFVLVDKTAAGAELYTVEMSCRNAGNAVLAASLVKLTQDN